MVTRIPFNGIFRVTGIFWQTTGVWTPNNPHKGIDLVGETSTNVYATCDGVVEFVGFDKYGFGNYVRIRDMDGLKHYYCHLKEYVVHDNDIVTYTTKLGVMGATGNVTGAHTHYEIRSYNKDGNYTLVNAAEYMGIPNVKGTYNSTNYPYDSTPTPPAPLYPYKVGDVVKCSSCYPSATSPVGFPPTGQAMLPARGCEVGKIVKIFENTANPYQVEDWYFVNNGDIREVITSKPLVIGTKVDFTPNGKIFGSPVSTNALTPYYKNGLVITKIVTGTNNFLLSYNDEAVGYTRETDIIPI